MQAAISATAHRRITPIEGGERKALAAKERSPLCRAA
jgi:hypothetical protein